MTLVLKRIELPRSYIHTAALQLGSAGLSLICISGLIGELRRMPTAPKMFSTGPVAGMLYLVIASSVLAFTAFHWLLAHDSPTMVATSAYVNPIVAMLLGIFVIHESWSATQLLGALVILGSIAVIWAAQKQSASHPADYEGTCVPEDLVSESLTAASAR
jgi:drug/metabolite transporter (DMT)-like permease